MAASEPAIYLLWPTVRPAVFRSAHTEWRKRARHPDHLKTLVAVNTQIDANELPGYNVFICNVPHIGVCYPAFHLTSLLRDKQRDWSIKDKDIVILASDDFLPPQHWDDYIRAKLEGRNPAALFVRDGYQIPDPARWHQTPYISLPIMTFGCLRMINYIIYHPDYIHMEADVELYENLLELGLLIDERLKDSCTFEHGHFVRGMRERDEWDNAWRTGVTWRHGHDTYNRRKKLSLQERLQL